MNAASTSAVSAAGAAGAAAPGGAVPYHPPVKRSVEIAGHKTSISLEPLFWDMLRDAAGQMNMPINAIVAQIDAERLAADSPTGLAGAVRIWLVARLLGQPGEQG